MKKVEEIISRIALFGAISAAGAASDWCTYQAKEPAQLKELLK